MKRCLKLLIIASLLVILVVVGHGYLLNKAGEYIYRRDELKPADVIVVLGGEETERVEYGARLFREGWARKEKIIMSGGPVVWKYTLASMMKDHAVHLGIPGPAVLLEDRSRSTEENARFTKEILARHGFRSVILITSPYHSRRADSIFRKIMGGDITIISAPVEKSWFSFDAWWKRRRDRAMVLNEYAKFLWLLLFGIQEGNP